MTKAGNIRDWIGKNLFDAMPMSVAVIDSEHNLVVVNKQFEKKFGDWRNRKCYEVYNNFNSKCPHCKQSSLFSNGKTSLFSEAIGVENEKGICHIRHSFPLKDEKDETVYLIEMTSDVPDATLIQQKYKDLFEHVPSDIIIIDRDFQIVETNQRSRELFGAIEGAFCYKVLKNRSNRCQDCTAINTFENGKIHSGRSTVMDKNGNNIELLVTTVPYEIKNGEVALVMEMAVDITNTLELQEELKITNITMRSLISSSLYGIIALDENDRVTIFNQAAERMLGINGKETIKREDLDTILPKGFLEIVSSSTGPIYLQETKVSSIEGISFPARLTGINLSANNQYKGMAFWIHDIRRIKKLEAEKLEAERMAAVGKTVAGLAHGIKNVLTGLEGGEYMLNSGLQKGDVARVQKGLEMLNRNTKRVSTFVKEFLNFSKGQKIETTLCDPSDIAEEVVNTYFVRINQLGIKLITEFQDNIELAPLDGEGMHECLSNLLGNAIDACRISENANDLQIIFRVFERDHSIIYEVIDNGCGMDYEVKRKAFTTFFTTKGLGGTGLGLLMTRKIVQQHGGEVEFDSILDKGTTFRIILPRDRLPIVHQVDVIP
ncbi:PAS domain S-box protein [bacterium]|nr:PAS domain S-box protein [bacterium]